VTSKPKSMIPTLSDLGHMWQASGLKEKLITTIVMIAVFRLGAQIPIWGVHPEAIKALASNQLVGFLDMFSGGALTSVSILALGIGPYITASIIMQLMVVVIPRLEELQKEEGEAGRKKMAQYTRYLTVFLALVQGGLVLKYISSVPGALAAGVTPWAFYPLAMICLTAGAMLALWIAELITERGIGNGASLLIFVGILSRIPVYASQTSMLVSGDPQKSFALVVLMLIYLAIIGLIIVLQQSDRKVFIVSAKRQVGRNVYGGQSTHIPFKINPAGVMPIIFAFAVLAFPSTIFGILQETNPAGWAFEDIFGLGLTFNPVLFYQKYFSMGASFPGLPWLKFPNLYMIVEFSLIVFFTFFYASITPSMQPKEIADQLKKYGSSIPGIKPGRPTAEKLEEILSKTTFIGAVALAMITLIASAATSFTGITTLIGLGSTSLIIMVGVALDTANQIKVHLMSKQYEGFLK